MILLILTCYTVVGDVSPQPEVNSNTVEHAINIDESSSQVRTEDQVPERKWKFWSTIWEHYKFASVNGKEKVVCNYCKQYAIGWGTKGLIDHQKTYKMRFGQRSIELYQNRVFCQEKEQLGIVEVHV